MLEPRRKIEIAEFAELRETNLEIELLHLLGNAVVHLAEHQARPIHALHSVHQLIERFQRAIRDIQHQAVGRKQANHQHEQQDNHQEADEQRTPMNRLVHFVLLLGSRGWGSGLRSRLCQHRLLHLALLLFCLF